MKIGIARETGAEEKRVILRPQELVNVARKHETLVEKGAGKGIGISDSEYEKVKVRVADMPEVYACDIVVRIKEPKEEELRLMRPGAYLMSMLHLPGNPKLRKLLKKYKVSAIPMEEIKNEFDERMIEALHQTGYVAMNKGFELWVADPRQCLVKIMGYGKVAWGAIRAAARKLVRKLEVLNKKDIYEMEKHIPGTDILVNGIRWPMGKRGKVLLIKRKMLKLFKPGAIILDLIANPEGQSPIETLKPGTLDNFSYKVDGVLHVSCWGWPGLDPVGISRRYSIQVAPILLEIADRGLDNLPEYIKSVAVKP